MKKLFALTLITAVVALMSNCSPKVAKTASNTGNKTNAESNPAQPPRPLPTGDVVKDAQGDRSDVEQVKLLSQVSEQRLDNGKQLYESTCKKCHDLHSPSERSSTSWVQIMKTMGPKANLEQGPYMMISAYLIKNAKG